MEFINQYNYEFNHLNIFIFAVIGIIALISTISFFVILFKKGDENKTLILKETCYKSSIVTFVVLLLQVICSLIPIKPFFDIATISIILLAVIALSFNIIYYVQKSKFKK